MQFLLSKYAGSKSWIKNTTVSCVTMTLLLCKKQHSFFFSFLVACPCLFLILHQLQIGLMQTAFTNQVWIMLWHYGSESNLVNAPLCDEILNLLKSH